MYCFLYCFFIVMALVFYFFKVSAASRRTYLWLVFFFCTAFALLIGFRPFYIPDTKAYIEFYNNLDPHGTYGFSFFENYSYYDIEYGFVHLTRIAKLMGLNASVFFVVISFLSTFLSYKGIKRICAGDIETRAEGRTFNGVLFLALYFSYYGLYYQGIAVRSGLAMALGLYATSSMMDRKYIKSIVFIILAFSVHRMGIIVALILLAYKFLPVFQERKFYLTVWAIICLVYLTPLYRYIASFSKDFLNMVLMKVNLVSAYSQYLNMGDFAQISKKSIFYVLVGLLPLLDRDFNKSKFLHRLVNVYYIGLIMIPLLSGVPLSNRIFDYVMIYSLPIVYLFATTERIKFSFRAICVLLITASYSWLGWSIIFA